MNNEYTLSILKPDAVANQLIGEIYTRFTANQIRVTAIKMTLLTKQQTEEFYAIHRDRPFFSELVEYMISGPVVISVLAGENAIAKYRNLMGATMPDDAEPGTIRYDLARGGDPTQNAVHGSDSAETAKKEIAFFFQKEEIF